MSVSTRCSRTNLHPPTANLCITPYTQGGKAAQEQKSKRVKQKGKKQMRMPGIQLQPQQQQQPTGTLSDAALASMVNFDPLEDQYR